MQVILSIHSPKIPFSKGNYKSWLQNQKIPYTSCLIHAFLTVDPALRSFYIMVQ